MSQVSKWLGPSSTAFLALKNALWLYTVWRVVWGWVQVWQFKGLKGLLETLRDAILKNIIVLFKSTPFGNRAIKKELGKTKKEIQEKVAPIAKGEMRYLSLPAQGLSEDHLSRELDRYVGMNKVDYRDGQCSGTVYASDDRLVRLSMKAYATFIAANPLHPDVFPGVRRMEAEVVQMTLRLFHAPLARTGDTDRSSSMVVIEAPGDTTLPEATVDETTAEEEDDQATPCGTMTSGGTESILLTCKAYRDWARAERGVTEPMMVLPVSAHAAFDKAGDYFGIRVVHVPVDATTRQADLALMRRAWTRDTIMFVGSAPSFAHGAVDDIEGITALANDHAIAFGFPEPTPVHVDACLGSFLVPFIPDLPPFDFRVPGVTSISCDTHKYGCAPKGTSVIMYAAKRWRNYQYYLQPNWTGGIYASPTMAGSRPGALIAACWATMMSIGRDGYAARAQAIMDTTRYMAKRLNAIEGIHVYGDPQVCVVAFGSDTLDIFQIGDALSARGWNLNILQYPSSIHLAVTSLTVPTRETFVADVVEAVGRVRAAGGTAQAGEVSAIYGLASSIPDRSLIRDISTAFLDALYHA